MFFAIIAVTLRVVARFVKNVRLALSDYFIFVALVRTSSSRSQSSCQQSRVDIHGYPYVSFDTR